MKKKIKKPKESEMKLILDGEVYLKEGRNKWPIPSEAVLQLVLHAIEEGLRGIKDK